MISFMKRIFVSIVVMACMSGGAAIAVQAYVPSTAAEAAVLMDVDTGKSYIASIPANGSIRQVRRKSSRILRRLIKVRTSSMNHFRFPGTLPIRNRLVSELRQVTSLRSGKR